MTERLSDQEIASYDSGVQSLPWLQRPSMQSLVPAVDLKEILKSDDHASLIQSLDRRDLYLALSIADEEIAIEVLPHVNAEQMTALLDYDAWTDEGLSIHAASKWLRLLKHESNGLLFEKFKDLEEEYQIGFLNPYVQLIDQDGFEALSHGQQDQFSPLPGQSQWYKLNNSDSVVEELVSGLIEGGFEGGVPENIEFTLSLLSHATYMPPKEDEARLAQFRRARLEEDGFLSYDDSLQLFARVDGAQLLQQVSAGYSQDFFTSYLAKSSDRSFLKDVLTTLAQSDHFDFETKEQVTRSLATVANMLAAACRLGPSDVNGLSHIVEQCHGLISVGLELAAVGNIDRGIALLIENRPKIFFQIGYGSVQKIRKEGLELLAELGLSEAQNLSKYFDKGQYGLMTWTIDTKLTGKFDVQTIEVLKGLYNRLPMLAVTKGHKIVFTPIVTMTQLSQLRSSMLEAIRDGKANINVSLASLDIMNTEGGIH
jgi:hypothetical protein